MSIITCNAWMQEEEYEWAQTSDPRILAVVQRDGSNDISELYDGDVINPIIYVEHTHGLRFSHVAGYDGGEADLMQQAYDQWGWNGTARRWLWIFHGIAADNAQGGYDRHGNWIVATSRQYRQYVGITEEPATYDEALKDVLSICEDLSYALDGEVYGVGYAVNELRRLHDVDDVDLQDWEVSIRYWGFVGEEYAKSEAAAFSVGEPPLPEMLPLPEHNNEGHTVPEGRE